MTKKVNEKVYIALVEILSQKKKKKTLFISNKQYKQVSRQKTKTKN